MVIQIEAQLTGNSTSIARIISLCRTSADTSEHDTVQSGVLVELMMVHFGVVGSMVLLVIVVVSVVTEDVEIDEDMVSVVVSEVLDVSSVEEDVSSPEAK
jgi:hypothetical protein